SEVASCETYLQNFTANLRGWLHASAPSTNFGQIEPLRYHMARSPFLRSALDGDVGLPELALGPVAHRVDYGAPRGGCCDDGYRGSEDTVPTGSSRIRFVEPDPDHDLYSRSDWTAIGCDARNRVRDLGSGVFMAWRSRLAPRRLALFHRLDEHAGRIRAHAATTLAVDGGSGGSQRDATIPCQHRVAIHSGARALVNDSRAGGP